MNRAPEPGIVKAGRGPHGGRADLGRTGRRHDVAVTDQVEYVIITASDIGALGNLVPALARLVRSDVVAILDVVIVRRHRDGAVTILEVDQDDAFAPLRLPTIVEGGLFSGGDIEMASSVVPPGTAAVLVLLEDRWLEPVSIAARHAGGRILAGERTTPARLEAALAASASARLGQSDDV